MLKTLWFLVLTYAVSCVYGYCIYNHSEDSSFFLRQGTLNSGGTYWSRFKRERLNPGENACCPYTSFDCNRNYNKDDIVWMVFKVYFAGYDKYAIYTVNLPAGGWLDFYSGGPGEPKVGVFNPDGTKFNYELQKNVPNLLAN